MKAKDERLKDKNVQLAKKLPAAAAGCGQAKLHYKSWDHGVRYCYGR